LKKEENLAVSGTSAYEKQIDKLRNELVTAKDQLNNTKKDNEVLMNSVPQLQREILDRKKMNVEERDEVE
jgi:peptidoglycan hydrolase CwlO-like protein